MNDSTSKKYYLVGAFDRHNYGDILFPLVHTEFLISRGVESEQIHYHAITSADLTQEGGYVTQSIRHLLKSNPAATDSVILCGGDILSADWMLMVAHLRSTSFLRAARIARRLFGVAFTNDLARVLLNELNRFPYVISKSDCLSKVYFTAVGGAGFKSDLHLKRVANELMKTDGVSVRDSEIQNELSRFGVLARLVPDTALIMSDYFPRTKLENRNWRTKLKVSGHFDLGNYYSFQGAKRLLEGHLDELANEISKTFHLTGMSPMFIPIGRAPDHEDHVVLEKLFERVKANNVPCAYQDSEHILDIMSSLAFARTYVGTSLHGAITTYSFGRKPTALFCNEVKKLKDFLKTWLLPEDFALHENAFFAERLSDLINNDFNISGTQQLQHQKELVKNEMSKYI